MNMARKHSAEDVEAAEARRSDRRSALINLLHDQRPDGGLAQSEAEPNREPFEPAGPVIEIFDADRLARRLGHGDGFIGDPAEANSDEDAAQARQIRLWSRMLHGSRGPWRKLVIADEAMLERLKALDLICPQFAAVTAWVVRAAMLSNVTNTPLQLDPAVVVGAPGVGKTFYARKLAEALAVPSEVIAMNLMTDRGSTFSGLSPVWKASAPGKVAQLLIEGTHACPLIVIDEIEKASPINPSETPVNVLHSLLERENTACFIDEFVDLPLRADHVVWLATANSLDPLPPSIIDRLIVFQVETREAEMLAIQQSIFHEANVRIGSAFAEPEIDLFKATAAHSPRTLSRVWTIAMGFACEAGRRHLIDADIRGAERILLAGKEGPRRPIGFIRSVANGETERE